MKYTTHAECVKAEKQGVEFEYYGVLTGWGLFEVSKWHSADVFASAINDGRIRIKTAPGRKGECYVIPLKQRWWKPWDCIAYRDITDWTQL